MNNDLLFWISWLLTIGLCIRVCVNGWLKPNEMLEWPFLACLICMYFYGYMAWSAFNYLIHEFEARDAVMGQFIVLLCVSSLVWGWRLGKNQPPKASVQYNYSVQKVWQIGLGLNVLASLVYFSFHGGALDRSASTSFQGSSAYWYMFFMVGYPGLAMSVWALFKMNVAERRGLMIISLLAFAVFIFPHIYSARRGPLFPAVVILLFVPLFSLRKKPNPALITGGLLLAGFLMLAFVQVRMFTYQQKTWNDAFNSINISEVVQTKATQTGDNEYINHIYLIGALSRSRNYQYGTGHLGLFLHWIPRSVWADKPALGEGWIGGSLFEDVNGYTGKKTLGGGAAAGGFADSFVQYGYFVPLFWFVLAYHFGRQFKSVACYNDPKHLFSYLAILCSSHWLFSQGFAAAFVPYFVFLLIPMVALRIARVEANAVNPRRVPNLQTQAR